MCPLGGSMPPSGTKAMIGRYQRVAELAGNRFGRGPQHDVVLARHEIGTVLLDAARRHQRRRLARLKRVADLQPGHVFDEHGIRGIDGPETVRIGSEDRRLCGDKAGDGEKNEPGESARMGAPWLGP